MPPFRSLENHPYRAFENHPERVAIEIRRRGDLLQVPAFAPMLPPRCVVCNEPATTRVRRTLHRATRPDSTAMFVAILVLCWPALLWLKPVFIEFGLCSAHARRARIEPLIATLATLGCFVGAFFAAAHTASALAAGLLIASAVGLVISGRRRAILRIAAREKDAVLLTVPARFLASFGDRG